MGQDSASIHCSKMTKEWLSGSEIEISAWESISSEMNHMGNLWDFFVRKVYGHGRQFFTVNDL